MDFGVFLRVIWRFRILFAVGLVLAALAGLLSTAKFELNGATPSVTYRANEEWISASTIFVTQEGFPWGRAILDEMVRVENAGTAPTYVPRYGDGGRLTGLAALYAELAQSDPVRRAVLTGADPEYSYSAEVVHSPASGVSLPLIYMQGFGPTAEGAREIADRATDAFQRYLAAEQIRNDIPVDKRVEVVVTRQATEAELFESRSLVRPVFLFLLVVMAFLALIFALENLRPRARQPAEVVTAARPARVRRSA